MGADWTERAADLGSHILFDSLRGIHDDLQRRAVRGTAWSGLSVGIRVVATIASVPILARLLTPEQYGIVALSTLITEIVALFGQLGLDSALIQRRRIFRIDLETAFWTDVAVGLALAATVCASAPFTASFFHQPALSSLLIVSSAGFLITGASATYNTILTRAMRYRTIAAIEMLAVFARTITAVAMALAGYAYFSLVVAGIVGFGVSALARVFVVRWRPRLAFSTHSFQGLFRFGRNILGDNMLFYISDNIDYLIIGRRLGAQALGYYEMAFALPDMVRKNMAATLTRVLYPIYSRVQDRDTRLRSGFFQVVEAISVVAFPLLAGLAVLAPQFVPLYFGPQWKAAIVPVQFLAITGMLRAVTIHIGTVLHARGRPDVTMKMTAVRTPLLGIVIWVGTFWGIDGTAAGFMCFSFLWSMLSVYILSRLTTIGLGEFLKTVFPALAATLGMVLFLLLIDGRVTGAAGAAWGGLITNVVLGGLLYLGILWLGWNHRVRAMGLLLIHLRGQT